MDSHDSVQVVILGGGFAGIHAAKELGRLAKREKHIQVHLVSNENYFVFQPLLPEVACCTIESNHILNPIRQLCPGIRFHCAAVTEIDISGKSVTVVGKDVRRPYVLAYDHLILSLGLTMNVSSVPGMAEHSLPIKTLGDAFHLRNHVLSRLEQAEIESDETERRRLLTFVGVGGGFSGVETIAALNDMFKKVLRFYPRAQGTGYRVVLVHSGSQVLNELDDELAKFAQAKLQERGVEVILNARVSEATAAGVVLSNGESLAAGTVICTIGNAPHPTVADLAVPQERGRVLADSFLRIKGATHLWALGDSALVPDERRGGFCPPTAQYAMRQGKLCARNVLATIKGQRLSSFQFGGLGQLAVVGRHCGVAKILGWKSAGLLAWFLWRSIYLMKLPGLRCKVRVGLDWLLDALFPHDITKIEVHRTEHLKRAHFRQGENIIRQGEIGDRFYVLESGRVAIIRETPDQTEEVLGTRAPGETFGEIALLKDLPRQATVRCLTPVDVITFSRQDFLALVGSHELLRSQLLTQMDEEMNKLRNPTDGSEQDTYCEKGAAG